MTTPPASPSLNGAAAATSTTTHRTIAPPLPQQQQQQQAPHPPQGTSSNYLGPAWTRNVVRTTTKTKTPYNGASGASASSLSLVPNTTTQDAPYLTHVHRHHGQLTLVAPDNLGARRQPGTVDPPSTRYDAGGGWGLIDADEAADYVPPPFVTSGGQDEDEEVYYSSKGKKLKSKKGAKKKEKEQKARRERAIMSAVANAGKSPGGPSPLPSPADEISQIHLSAPTAPSSGTTPRASPGLSSVTSSTGSRPPMAPRTGSGTSSSLQQQATAAARRTRRTRPAVPAVGASGDAGSSSFTSGSSALGESPHRRPLEGPRPQPISIAAAASASSETLRTPSPGVPAFINAPQPAVGAGPLQQSRAVARARAARNAHAAVKAAGIQARAIQAIQAQAQAQREELPMPPVLPSSSPRPNAAGHVTGADSAAMSPSFSASGTGRPAAPLASDIAPNQRQQRPRMRHRPSEPLLVPEAIPPRQRASASQPAAQSAASGPQARSRGRSESRSSEHAGGANGPPTALAPSTSSSGPNSLPPPILPPLDLSDPALIEDHLSLGLIDPAMLLMSPPPAYSGRRSLSSTRTARTARPSQGDSNGRTSPGGQRTWAAGSAAGLGLGMERIRPDNDSMSHPSPRYSSIPPSGSPPPPHSRRASPTPSTSTAATTIRRANARLSSSRLSPPLPLTSSSSSASDGESESGRLSSSDSASDEDEDADSFEVTSTDPLVLAWEADRSAGIYTLDERIARDLARRRRAAGEETGDEGTPVDESFEPDSGGGSDREAAEDGEAPSRAAASRSAIPSRVYSSRTEVAAADLAQLRRRISHAEASNNSRGVVRALSVHATRSLRTQGRVARERRGRAAEAANPPAEASEVPVARSAQAERSLPYTETIVEDGEDHTNQPAPSTSAASASGAARRPDDQAQAGGSPVEDTQLARTLSLRGHRMLAEAAERRMRAEKEARLKASSAVHARETLHEDDGDAEQAGPSMTTEQESLSAVASQSKPLSPPPRARQPPPPPPPRSRPAPAERSPAPAFTTAVPPIAWGAATGASSQTPLRRPASIRRVPPPPPPNAAEILAAKRASLRPVAGGPSSGASASQSHRPVPPPPAQQEPITPAASPPSAAPTAAVGLASESRQPSTLRTAPSASDTPSQAELQSAVSSSVSPPRRRPLPAPPRVLSENRIDAFTALRQSQELSPRTGTAGGEHAAAGPTAARDDRPERTGLEEPAHPGPPLPRRPPGRAPPAPPTAEIIALETQDRNVGDSSERASNTGTSIVRDHTASTELPRLDIPELSMYTDLDLLLARLESGQDAGAAATGESTQRNAVQPQGGENYDDLLVLSDVLGQAVPAGATAAELAETLAVARVECERRRVTKDGKVKSKLSVVGVRCVDCAICLARFKVDQFAVVLPDCLHIFHEHCIRSWFRLSRVCPVCRHEVFEPRNAAVVASDSTSSAATPAADLS